MSLLPIATPFPRGEIEISSTQDHHLVVCPPHQHHRRQTQLRDTNHSWLYSCRPAGGGSWFYTMGCFVLLILVNYLIFFLLDFLLFIPSFLVVLVQEKKKTHRSRSVLSPLTAPQFHGSLHPKLHSFILGPWLLGPSPQTKQPAASTRRPPVFPAPISEFLDTVRPSVSDLQKQFFDRELFLASKVDSKSPRSHPHTPLFPKYNNKSSPDTTRVTLFALRSTHRPTTIDHCRDSCLGWLVANRHGDRRFHSLFTDKRHSF